MIELNDTFIGNKKKQLHRRNLYRLFLTLADAQIKIRTDGIAERHKGKTQNVCCFYLSLVKIYGLSALMGQ